jgi:hypothetical protein
LKSPPIKKIFFWCFALMVCISSFMLFK